MLPQYKLFLTLIFSVLALIGCTSVTENVVAPQAEVKVNAPYQIGSGDVLDIRVWQNPELSVTQPVRPDGRISIPLIKEVLVTGKTTAELEALLTEKFDEFIIQPLVTVIVTQPNSAEYLHRVRITGAVNQQLSVVWRDGMTVLDLVLLAGSTTAFAAENKAILYRKTEAGLKAYPVYLEDILKKGRLKTNYTLVSSDILTVPERAF